MEKETKESLQRRIDEISELIFEVANGNFDYTIDASKENDELDAIISGVNMLGQELKKSTVSRDHIQSMLDGVIDMILVLDLDMQVEKTNDTYVKTMGFELSMVKGKKLTELIDLSGDDSLIEDIAKQLKKTGKYSDAELYLKTSEEDTIPTSASFSYLKNVKGDNEGIMIVARDITKIKETEQNLIHAKELAEEANLAKGRFLSNMSHEIRTPLNGIIGFAELLQTGDMSDSQREYVDMICHASTNLAKLLNDVLDLNRIDLDRIELENIPFDFRATFTSNLNPYIFTANEKGVELNYTFDESVPKIVIGDPNRLNQVLVNLVSNAIKFTKIGFVDVSFEGITKDNQDHLKCEVTDTGIGIPKEKQEQIFEAFTQSDNSITRNFGGSGLGLAICKQLIDLMGGDIEVDSPLNGSHGTTFRFTIPIKAGVEKKNARSNDDFDSSEYSDVKVLAVDDNKVNLVLIERILEGIGVQVDTASNGKDAVMKAKKTAYDLILMDIQMPVMDGLSASKVLRKEGFDMPILALSANVDKENIQAIRDAGMNDFLQKPFHKPQIMKFLKKWITVQF